ncbi:MAG: DUF167 domain-containing protein [Candidatus Helarchaeota archaeon]|nr:DUF167 domain-containing protein [Candidatus Helarchaeota archaeon]
MVKPHSKQVNIKQLDPKTYEIAISSKPEKGKANKEIIEELAKFFKIKKSKITILKGHKSRHKIIQIEDF